MKRYNPKEIEPHWQKIWEETQIYKASEDTAKPKRYVLEYFPYPSGAAMHVGHVRNYTIGDAVARFWRARGYNVLHPMGWDAFGLPAENYAIKNNISPAQAIAENTSKFKQQLTQMGFSYDWSREINSSDPSYYRWTQWFFKLLFDRGLAYQKESLQWWCETDKTVLANEQVESGKCWRCGNEVTKKSLNQWFFKITDYADRLVEDLEDLDWSEAIKSMQRNWIGKSIGAEIDFPVEGTDNKVKVYTTRPDTIYGVSFLVLAPEHPLVQKVTTPEQKSSIEDYIKQSQAKSDVERQETDREKTGVFTGAYATNPINQEKVPIWIADYVLFGYGTGAIMAVPAHDERDREFAQKYKIDIVQVVSPYIKYTDKNAPREGIETQKKPVVDAIIKNEKGEYLLLIEPDNTHFVGGGIEDFDKDDIEAVKREVLEESGYDKVMSVKPVSAEIIAHGYRYTKNINQYCNGKFYEVVIDSSSQQKSEIEDGNHTIEWVKMEEVANRITWQAHFLAWQQYIAQSTVYTGEGLMINSGKYDGMTSQEAREKIVEDLEKSGTGQQKTQYKIRDWLISRQRYWGAPIPIIHCEKDGAIAVPENQLPVVLPEVESYAPKGEGSVLETATDWVNTTCPKCGGPAKRETDTMDGFACSSWYFLRFADPHNENEPFSPEKAKFWLPVDDYIGGAEHAVMHLLYARMWTKVMYDAGLIDFNEPFKALRNQGMILAPDGRKMSKSWGNVIAPDDVIAQGYGADSVRVMELFIGPWDQAANWSVEGMGGCFRFLQRIWTLKEEFLESNNDNSEENKQITIETHKLIHRVSNDLEKMQFNTAISGMMEYVNFLYKVKAEEGYKARSSWQFALSVLAQLLGPFAPHIAEELWHNLGNNDSVHVSAWPVHDPSLLVSDKVTIVVQVNGKVRANIKVSKDAEEQDVIAEAKADPKVTEYIKNKELRKTIYVAHKIVNFVV